MTVRVRVSPPAQKRRKIMDAVIVEIRAGEGGNDAKLLVEKLTKIYRRYCDRRSL